MSISLLPTIAAQQTQAIGRTAINENQRNLGQCNANG